MPEIRNLAEVNLAIYGNQVVVGKDKLQFTPEGQILVNFSSPGKSPVPLPVNSTEELFFQALEHEYRGEWNRAQEKYESLLKTKPEHPDTLVNLGNIRYRQGSMEEAEQCYRKALWFDPDHVEANYNLANLLEDREDLNYAVLFYSRSVHGDPEFADAHFNLGMVLERLGNIEGAKKHWRIYLDLDPTSEWADYLQPRADDGGGDKR